MAILQARAVVKVKDGMWDQALDIAAKQAADANTRVGTLAYEMYRDDEGARLINIAAYRDADAWLAHTQSNPFSGAYMATCELESLEVHGEPTPELLAIIRSFGAAVVYPAVPHD
jgi:quinol monooxygenase YgiN